MSCKSTVSLSSYSPTPRAAQPYPGLLFPPDLCSLRRWHWSGPSSSFFSYSEEAGWGIGVWLCQRFPVSSHQGCDLQVPICSQTQRAHCHAQCGYALLPPCVFPDVCHLADPTHIYSTLQTGWGICLPPAAQTHTLYGAGCMPGFSQL